jgi:hypothetical protein
VRRLAVLLLALGLAACGGVRPGVPIEAISDARVAAAFIPLQNSGFSLTTKGGSATLIAPGIAVTNAHNAELVPKADVIGISRDYDLMFFRTRLQVPVPRATPYSGEHVTAYGHVGEEALRGSALRMAHGIVVSVSAPLQPNCRNCPQAAFVFQGNAGPGFSGGPVLDAASGNLVGITFGYTDEDKDPRKWIIYAYHMHVVDSELARLRGRN